MNTPTKVLITEDEMIVALDLERRLRKLGYDCVLASSAEEAIAAATEQKPHVALMDICLNGDIDGIAAAETIRARTNVPIIYLTANADEYTLQRAELTHPASYLLKPFKERELQICIEMALINHALQQELRTARDEMEKRVIERTTELLKTNEALRKEIKARLESEAQVREQAGLLDKSRDAIYVRSLKGEIMYWNQGAEFLYGIRKLEAIGHAADSLLYAAPEVIATALERTQVDGEWIGELPRHNRDGAERIVESRWTFMPDKSAVLVVETDISERKKLEAQFLRAQRLESIGALASGVAHDLNNVFTPLIMTSQLLNEEITDPKTRQLVDIISSSARHGSEMVKQVLMFVRGSDSDSMPFRMEHLVKDIVNLLRETFPRSIRIRSSYATNLWSVVGDASRLHQVLMNLCVNARDAMPNGGELTITLSNFRVDEAFAKIQGNIKPGDFVRIDIADTGTGMPPEIQKKIFDPFFTTKAPGKGTGLGLATVQTIVQSHNGFLALESEPGRGTTFRIYLPACDESDKAPASPVAKAPHGSNELVLIADDERSVREIVKTTLEACGYRTMLADDGISALSQFALHQNEIACVIVDMEMPNLAGLACAQALRQLSGTVAILLVSGISATEVPQQQITSLGAKFLSKPFSKDDLLHSLARSLNQA
ncbi:MAG: response regulator [Nibricoccus sp.]